MRDLVFIAFLAALFGIGIRRPFVLVLTYVYIDIVAPQRLTFLLLNSVPISLIAVIAAVGAWAIVDDKRDVRFAPRQLLMLLLLIYCGVSTSTADFPVEAAEKWSWVWKALAFAIFLPLTLRTRLRFESLGLFMIFSAASIIIVGGIKTLAGGGGYGTLNLMQTNNTGLYESSIISAVAIAIIPLIAFFMKHSMIFPVPDWRVKLFGCALIFSCLLMPIGTQARTGLICIAVLGLLSLRYTKRRFMYIGLVGAAFAISIPMLPDSFTARMKTIQGYKSDSSAGTRIAVWAWTWDYANEHPFGGGFQAYLQNNVRYETETKTETSGTSETSSKLQIDKARAYHSSYFEMLGEQGFPGLFLWLAIHIMGLVNMEYLLRKYRNRDVDDDQWIGALAGALQQGQIIYLVGAIFVGIAFQPFMFMLIGMQIGLSTYATRRSNEARRGEGFGVQPMQT